MKPKSLRTASMRRPLLYHAAWGLLIVLGALLAGCGGSGALRLYVNPEADMGYYKRVAVLQLANMTQDGWAGARVTRAFTTELIISERFEVVEDAVFRKALQREVAEPDLQGLYDPEKVKKVAASVQANAIIKGVVTEYQMQRFGNSDAPVIAFEVEMVDLESGATVWRGSISKRGEGGMPIVGGEGTKTLGRLVQQASREMIEKLEREAF